MTTYRVSEMTCDGCARAIAAAIKNHAPSAVVTVSVENGEVTVDGMDDDSVIAQAVSDAGFDFRGAVTPSTCGPYGRRPV